ncbi:MAG: DinB family protein [Chitinophagales bacterium]
MTTQQLLEQFKNNHYSFVAFIKTLNDEQFALSANNKWTPGQQLEHIYKCNQPLAFLFANKAIIESKFGKIERARWSQAEVREKYTAALATGGKAPERFVPAEVSISQKEELLQKTVGDVNSIVALLANFTEEEIDNLAIPHPLLGNMSIREMMYLMTDHATHHLEKTKENLGIAVS